LLFVQKIDLRVHGLAPGAAGSLALLRTHLAQQGGRQRGIEAQIAERELLGQPDANQFAREGDLFVFLNIKTKRNADTSIPPAALKNS